MATIAPDLSAANKLAIQPSHEVDQFDRRRLADATARPGHDDHPAVQIHPSPLRQVSHRLRVRA